MQGSRLKVDCYPFGVLECDDRITQGPLKPSPRASATPSWSGNEIWGSGDPYDGTRDLLSSDPHTIATSDRPSPAAARWSEKIWLASVYTGVPTARRSHPSPVPPQRRASECGFGQRGFGDRDAQRSALHLARAREDYDARTGMGLGCWASGCRYAHVALRHWVLCASPARRPESKAISPSSILNTRPQSQS